MTPRDRLLEGIQALQAEFGGNAPVVARDIPQREENLTDAEVTRILATQREFLADRQLRQRGEGDDLPPPLGIPHTTPPAEL